MGNCLPIIKENMSKQSKLRKILSKGVDLSPLSSREQKAMIEHSKHHTKNHIQEMVNLISNGATFTEAHKKAMQTVGR